MKNMRTVKKLAAPTKAARVPTNLKVEKESIINSNTNLRSDGDRLYSTVVRHKTLKHGTVATAFRNASGITTNTKELVVKITDYLDFDSAEGSTPIRTYLQGINHSIFSTATDGSNPGCVFRKLKVSALPQAVNAAVAAKTFLFQGGVQSLDKVAGGDRLVSTVNTVVKSDFNVQWTTVGNFDYLRAFKDSNYEPKIVTLAGDDYQDLLRYAIIDPDTGDGFGTDNPVRVQLRFELTVAYPLAPANSVTVVSGPTTTWTNSITAEEAVVSDTYATIDLQSLSDSR
jgi:hypothetical protein